MWPGSGISDLTRRRLLLRAAAVAVLPAATAGRHEAHRFRTADFDIEMTVYKVRPRPEIRAARIMREYVRTVDRDARLRDRPPFERAIELQRGAGSDLQAFGYESPSAGELSGPHSPWYLFRQDLFLEPQHKPFLVIFWKHALSSIRVMDIIPGEQTWPVSK